MINALSIIDHFYSEDSPLKALLLKHSRQVAQKALEIADMPANSSLEIDREIVEVGAMLHDIGIKECHAPSILCNGEKHYIAHGIVGAEMLRLYGRSKDIDLECYARICERHTGSGLSAKEIIAQGLPIPPKDFIPETIEEKLVCLADSFFSKSGNMEEKTIEHVRNSMSKFGNDTIERFDAMCQLFHL